MPDNKTVVITGTNRGIGLELVRHYASKEFGACHLNVLNG